MRIFFSSIIDASVNLVRGFPLRVKKKTKKTKNETLNLWSDLENFKVLFLRNSRKLGFLSDLIIYACSPNVLKYVYNVVVLNRNYESFCIPIFILQPVLSYFPSYFISISMIDNSWSTELIRCRHDKTKNLSLTSVILKGRNISLVNLFCRYQWYLARVCYYNAPHRKFAEVFCYKKKNCYGEELFY